MSAVAAPPMPTAPAEPALLTAEEFFERHAGDRVELVRGRVVELPMPSIRHGKICVRASFALCAWADAGDHGHVMSNDSFVRLGTASSEVRGPDVCYFSYERLPCGPVPEGILPVVPDFTLEVRSPSDTWSEVFVKVGDYLGAGVRAVVVLDVATMTAAVYRPEALQQIFAAGDDLTVPEVLPGFSVRVGRLFE